MNENLLYRYMDGVVDKARIGADEVARLEGELFPNGLSCRDEADILIALDRAIADKDASWAEVLTRLVVNFVVWESRPTGYVDAETAQWLVTSLACGDGPSDLAIHIAFEVVKECERADESLVAFVLRARRRRAGGVFGRGQALRGALAA